MSQFLLSVWHDGEYPQMPEVLTDELAETYKVVEQFNQGLIESGNWVFAGGLQHPSTSIVIEPSNHINSTNGVNDNLETKDLSGTLNRTLGGFWVIEATDMEEATEIAKRASNACREKVEVRPFQG